MTRDEMFENVCDLVEELHGELQSVGLPQDDIEFLLDLEELLDHESQRIAARLSPAPVAAVVSDVRSCGELPNVAHDWRPDMCDSCGGAIGMYCKLCGMYGGPADGHELCDCIPF